MSNERSRFDAEVGATPKEGRGQTASRPAIVFLRSLGEKQEVTLIARSKSTERLQNMVRILSFLTQSPDAEAASQIQSHAEHKGRGDAHLWLHFGRITLKRCSARWVLASVLAWAHITIIKHAA